MKSGLHFRISFARNEIKRKKLLNYIFIYLKRERYMDKRLMSLVAGLTLSTSMAFAQSQISGKVTSSED